MINLKVKKNPMPEQAPDIRNHNFEEVSEGYTPQMAINEAMRCLNCREKPCTHGCPDHGPDPGIHCKDYRGRL